MDEELKTLLRQNLKVSEESLDILRGIRRGQRIGTAINALKWLFVLAATFGAYYYLQPLLERGLEVIANPAGALELEEGSSFLQSTKLSPETISKLREVLLQGGR